MNKIIIRMVICIVLVVAAVVLFSVGFRYIQDGYMGVEISVVGKERVLPQPLRAGWYWRRPLMVQIETYSINERSARIEMRNALDQHKKWVNARGTVYYQLQGEKLVDLHKKYDNSYRIDNKVKSFFEWKLKATLSEFSREDVFGKERPKLVELMTKRMKDSFDAEGIMINEVVIEDVSFPNNYTEDINSYPTTSIPMSLNNFDCNTSDKQRLILDFKVYYHIDPKNAERVHNELGTAYVKKDIEPAAKSVISRVTTLYPMEDIYNGKTRAKVEADIEKNLKEKMADNGIEIDDVMITDVSFDADYQNILDQIQKSRRNMERLKIEEQENKIRAEIEDKALARKRENEKLDAEAAKEAELIRSRGIREAEIIRAEGKAEALLKVQKIIAENPDILRYLYVDKISDKVKVIVMPSNDNKLSIDNLMHDKSK
ncbi:SPFH domain-containing protein [Candidatus Uabimicrobium amorphum]|uniref:Protein HflC n=1 Tax=Uabimicrobium amorphum TaxID=2596890 RepID=A0A5S9F4C2_UABAM|nr:SPFH domain-containing protein [Candidatus Uabimicrobium amorphum]BBM85141.1 protein HflC [Candidatus Uabimicrobium amorphum]